LEKFAAERAVERGYQMLAAPEVTLASDGGLQTGTFQVRAMLVDVPARPQPASEDGKPPEDFSQTRAMRPLEMPLGPTGFETLYLAGAIGGREQAWPLSGGRLTVGRGLDNDIVLDDASVSRHHAELTREGGRLQVRDLGSRNGTWVNAARVTVSGLGAGDELAFGAVQLEVTRRAA
jgi:pSer/pThr/pTyr-binding forkhead associated (FHA) protein